MRAPDVIYLQWYGDGDPEWDNEELECADVTWAAERIYDADIVYRRERTCVWTSRGSNYATSCEHYLESYNGFGDSDIGDRGDYCRYCGGRIRIEEAKTDE